ncbi:MAG: VOC family protein, partial [Chloroflexota bacterium]
RIEDNPSGFHLAFVVADLEKVYKAALEAGATSINSPEPQPWGGHVARIRDLNGVLVAIGSKE